MPHVILDLNTNRVYGQGLYTKDGTTGADVFLNGTADLGVTLVDHDSEAEIAGETWPVALTYITDTDGNFHAPIRADQLALTEFQLVDAIVAGDNGVDQILNVTLECIVQKRRQ